MIIRLMLLIPLAALSLIHLEAQEQTRRYEVENVVTGEDSQLGPISRIAGLAVDKAGVIYVLDGIDRNIKVFDARGTLSTTFARPGRGPGELQNPISLRLHNDTLVVRDMVNGFVTFTRDGKHVSTRQANSVPGTESTPLRHSLILHSEVPTPAAMRASDQRTGRFHRQVYILHPSRKMDTIASIPLDFVTYTPFGGNPSRRLGGFGHGGAAGVSGDSVVVVADGIRGTVTWYDITPSGARVKRTEKLPVIAHQVTREDIRRQEVRLTPQVSATWSFDGNVARARSTARPANVQPGRIEKAPAMWSVASQIFVSPEGTVWLGAPRLVTTYGARNNRVVVNKKSVENNTWYVFPPRGAPYVLQLSPTLSLGAVNGNRAYAVSMMTDDVPGVHVLRIVP